MSGFRVKHGMTKGLLAMMAVVSIGIFLFANHSAQAVDDWTLDNIQGNNITSSNNPGGYTNNTPSQSPDNSTNFSPAFGGGSSAITVNGSGFSMPDYDINAVEVSKGMMYSCYLSYAPDSWLYCWGYNYRGQLGDGTNATRATPVPIARGQISVGEIITAFSTGREHACVITSANKTYCWGYNHDGALGIGANSNEPYYAPVLVGQGDVSNGEYFKSISAGVNHTCAVSDRDKVYCWGNGSYGQLGQNNTMSYYAPKRVKTVSDGGSFVMPDNVKQVDVSSSAVSGSIGINSYSCAVAADDMVYCWGNNSFGQLGDNTIVQRNAPVRIHGMSGTIFHQVEATVYSTCALTSAGLIYCWGSNDRGQLGNGTTDNSSIPIAVTGGTVFREIGVSQSRSFCAISNDDVAYCWGMKYIGDGATTPSDANAVPTPLKTVSGGGTMPDGVISVSIGDGSSSNQNSSGCAVATDNKVYCWGYISNTAPFGDNSYPPNSGTAYVRGAPAQIVQFAELPKVQFDDIYGSECNSVVVLSANQLRCFSPSSISNGLHDILVTYHSETRTLPQSYMYKTIPNPLTNLTAVGKNKMVNLNWSWQDEKPYITSASFYVQCKRSDSSTWWSPTRSNCDTALQGNNFLSTGSTNSSSAIILGLQNGVSYDFRVQSSENSLSSVYVFYIYNVIPQASPYVPSSPTIVDAVVSSSGTGGSLYWTTPQYDGGSTITG
jgi:alpha-tubulin suppressor-like RCC1 family protein